MMSITPMILGKGRAGAAIARSFAILQLSKPELNLQPVVWLPRGAKLAEERKKYKKSVLCIANPHGLHADAILEGHHAGFDAILCEKPACVNPAQLQSLRSVSTPTAILHVYRQMWGIQHLKEMLEAGDFGDLVTVEGRYWQSSTAERALAASTAAIPSWKDDTRLSGPFDTYLDIATHWLDAVSFLQGRHPSRVRGWRSYSNAPSPHRDSHVQLDLEFPGGGRAFGSISKNIHGATNHFEINVIGSRLAATWEFLSPDELRVGEGKTRRVITRQKSDLGSGSSPFHGMGWLEGYIEITARLLAETFAGGNSNYPRLKDNLGLLQAMFETRWQDSDG